MLVGKYTVEDKVQNTFYNPRLFLLQVFVLYLQGAAETWGSIGTEAPPG